MTKHHFIVGAQKNTVLGPCLCEITCWMAPKSFQSHYYFQTLFFTTGGMDHLLGLENKLVQIITNDGRIIQGILSGFDQTINIILKSAYERIFTTTGTHQIDIGLFLIRGDTILLIGLVDEIKDQEISWDKITITEPLKGIFNTIV